MAQKLGVEVDATYYDDKLVLMSNCIYLDGDKTKSSMIYTCHVSILPPDIKEALEKISRYVIKEHADWGDPRVTGCGVPCE